MARHKTQPRWVNTLCEFAEVPVRSLIMTPYKPRRKEDLAVRVTAERGWMCWGDLFHVDISGWAWNDSGDFLSGGPCRVLIDNIDDDTILRVASMKYKDAKVWAEQWRPYQETAPYGAS